MNMKLKLPKITANDPIERLAVGVKQSTLNLLKQYQSLYKEAYGEEIPLSTLVDDVLRRFILEDKEFVKTLNSKQPKVKSEQSSSVMSQQEANTSM